MKQSSTLGCVIMASGQGKRFGGNKLMAPFWGEPMIARILRVTEGIFSSRVVVTCHEDVAAFARGRGADVILHHLPYRSDTVRLGVDAMGQDVAGCVFCPGDQPLLTRQTLQALAQAAGQSPEYFWQVSGEAGVGMPVYFPRAWFDRLRALPQGKGGNVLLKEHPELVRFIPVQSRELQDVDTPEDLYRLQQEP